MSDARESPRIGEDQIKLAVEEHMRFQGRDSQTSGSSFIGEDDVSSETHRFSSQESDESVTSSSDDEPDVEDQPIRIYDARFKIPAQSNIGQLMSAKNSAELSKGQSSKEYRNMVKNLERYKKFVSTSVICLMALVMLYTIVVYVLIIRDLQGEKYYLARTRYEVEKEIDFELIKVNEIKYFLYRNRTKGA